MATIQECMALANQKVNTADHLTFVTFPTVQESKILLGVIENLYTGMLAAVDAILLYERQFKRIGPYANDVSVKLDVFKTKCADRYNFDRLVVVLIVDMGRMLEAHKKSPMEVAKKDRLVIFSDSYQIRTVSIETIKNHVHVAKAFVSKANKVLVNVGRY